MITGSTYLPVRNYTAVRFPIGLPGPNANLLSPAIATRAASNGNPDLVRKLVNYQEKNRAELVNYINQHLSFPSNHRYVDAEDVLHDFITDLIEKFRKDRYDRMFANTLRLNKESEMRNLLFLKLRRFLVDQARTAQRNKRGGQAGFIADIHNPSVQDQLSYLPLVDETESILKRAGLTDHERKILQLRLQKHTMQEIADKLGVSRRSAERTLNNIKFVFEELKLNDRSN